MSHWGRDDILAAPQGSGWLTVPGARHLPPYIFNVASLWRDLQVELTEASQARPCMRRRVQQQMFPGVIELEQQRRPVVRGAAGALMGLMASPGGVGGEPGGSPPAVSRPPDRRAGAPADDLAWGAREGAGPAGLQGSALPCPAAQRGAGTPPAPPAASGGYWAEGGWSEGLWSPASVPVLQRLRPWQPDSVPREQQNTQR